MQDAPERLRTALFKDALAKLVLDPQVQKGFDDQLLLAWANWARVRTGTKSSEYVVAAFEMYLLMAACLMVEKGWTTEKVARSLWCFIPQKLPRKGYSPFELIVKKDVFKIKDEYRHLLCNLRKIQRKKWRNPAAHILALKEILPGIHDGLIKKWADDEASDIAARCLGRKYSVGAEMLKKWIQKTQFPRLIKWLDKECSRNCQPPKIGSKALLPKRLTPRP